MKISLIIGILLFSQQMNPTNNIMIRNEGKTIEIIDRSDITLPNPEGHFLNIEQYEQLIEKLEKQIYQKPKNADIDEFGNIRPEQIGYKLNRTSFTMDVYKNILENSSSVIEIQKQPIYPEIDSELLSHIFEKQVGQYITYFNARNKKRSYNISLATEAINNQVVFPGQTFSFNHVVGKRTKDKGYLPAPVIVKGELSEGIGGGICQVSSTLYNAVDNTGLHIVERYSHSKNVPYVPLGRDATVSWYGPDFIFQNKYNQPILIRAKTYEGKLIIKIYSSDLINFKPRKVPSASQNLPKEIKVITETDYEEVE